MKDNLVIAHGGGPTAVINASLAGSIKEAQRKKEIGNILVCRNGIEGLIRQSFIDCTKLGDDDIEKLKSTPGSAPGSCRYKVSKSDYPTILEVLRDNNARYFLYTGGNDSMDTCNKISKIVKDINVIGIPKTIDNDLNGTDHCPGFGSAARYAAITTLELGLDVKALPIHVVVIETMGRNAGWLVGATSFARTQGLEAPHLIYFPERIFKEEQFIEDVKICQKKFGRGIVVSVSEGICGENGRPVADSGLVDSFGHTIPGGTAQYLSNTLIKAGIKSRWEKPGLIGRASKLITNIEDREEAYDVGVRAVQAAVEGKSGYMVGYKRISNKPYKISFELVDLDRVANFERLMPDSFINKAGNDITEDFKKYCEPLIGNNFPEYFKFN